MALLLHLKEVKISILFELTQLLVSRLSAYVYDSVLPD